MFCVSLLASYLVDYTYIETVAYSSEIGVHWPIFWLASRRAHENWNHGPKYYNKWMMFSVSVWFVVGWGRNDRIWRWKIVIRTRRQSRAGGSSDFVCVDKFCDLSPMQWCRKWTKKAHFQGPIVDFFCFYLFFNFIGRLLANTLAITNIAIKTNFSHTRNASSERQLPS